MGLEGGSEGVPLLGGGVGAGGVVAGGLEDYDGGAGEGGDGGVEGGEGEVVVGGGVVGEGGGTEGEVVECVRVVGWEGDGVLIFGSE